MRIDIQSYKKLKLDIPKSNNSLTGKTKIKRRRAMSPTHFQSGRSMLPNCDLKVDLNLNIRLKCKLLSLSFIEIRFRPLTSL